MAKSRTTHVTDAESARLKQADHPTTPWRKWGPYLSERQWGTVREDYSADGCAWEYFPHDHARSRAYRWGEDGIAGISDDKQVLCFALAMWNGHDPILKERLFGLTGPEGNHGEDVKELYYYLDATPTHSYLKMLYKYPQARFPYDMLVRENAQRSKQEDEFEVTDTGVFSNGRYFDVFVEYAKADVEDILVRITVHNRANESATLHMVPQMWFRNTWSWDKDNAVHPGITRSSAHAVLASHPTAGDYHLYCEQAPQWLFTNNDTNTERLYGSKTASGSGHYKDAFHDYVVHNRHEAVNPSQSGTKVGALLKLDIGAHGSQTLRLRLSRPTHKNDWKNFDKLVTQRVDEADAFYDTVHGDLADNDARLVQRQALAGMIWSKQFYHFDVLRWLNGDPSQPKPPDQRLHGRNSDWEHLNNGDVLSMPDKWEYPWYAAWDLAFHTIPLAMVDPEFAKQQLVLLTREWYMHPNGQLPAYEWAFGDVNPPVHAWATWRVYEIDRQQRASSGDPSGGDIAFLERVFHKLLLNFTWWVNRKDRDGRNVFQGGFLGLDNIGVFDRSAPLPGGGYITQADGTGWMAMYCLNLMRISLELARHNPVYQDTATKFFEHFLFIAAAMNNVAGEHPGDKTGVDLWDEQDEFYYDVLGLPDGQHLPLKVRSMVGLIPLFAVEVLDTELLDHVPEFKARLEWFLNYRKDLASLVSRWHEPSKCKTGSCETRLLSLLRGHRMKCLLRRALDETEFLSPYGVRALSRFHKDHPYDLQLDGQHYRVHYEPGESRTNLFGGNSNWRGPVWMPVNYLIIESLRRFHSYYGDDFVVECPTGSGNMLNINQVADELSRRLAMLFLKDEHGRRATLNGMELHQSDPHFADLVPFHEYFHGDTGRGVGASHQTGWTGLVAMLLADTPSNKLSHKHAPPSRSSKRDHHHEQQTHP